MKTAQEIREEQIQNPREHPWMIPIGKSAAGIVTPEGARYDVPWADIEDLPMRDSRGFSERSGGQRTIMISRNERHQDLVFRSRVTIHESKEQWELYASNPAWGSVILRSDCISMNIPLLHYGAGSIWNLVHQLSKPTAQKELSQKELQNRQTELQGFIERNKQLKHASIGGPRGGVSVQTTDTQLLAIATDCGIMVRENNISDEAPDHQRLTRSHQLMKLLKAYDQRQITEEIIQECRLHWTMPTAPWGRNQLVEKIEQIAKSQFIENKKAPYTDSN